MTRDEQRREAVRLMKSRAGRNEYTNGGKRNRFFGVPEGADGFSDCSSAVRACIERASGIDIGSNTDKQLRGAEKGVVVHCTKGGYPDEEALLPGDCLYFRGNKSHFKQVGHVEMYSGPNECWGHGSGIGPTKKDLREYCRRRLNDGKPYFAAVRWIPNEEAQEAGAPVQMQYAAVTAKGTWRIRKSGSLAARTVGYVRQGERLRLYGVIGDWAAVKTIDGKLKGWISTKAIKKAV